MPANALLMGERAAHAPVASMQTAVQMYQKGASHKQVWQQTGWYCPQRQTGKCRWETPPDCTRISLMNITAIRHTAFTGKIPLWRVFNASCVWNEYPALRERVVVFFGGCRGALGTASHDGSTGEICVSGELLRRIKSGAPDADKLLYEVFIHELQHQIQFVEKWPVYDETCPYELRKLEREAFLVGAREFMPREQRRKVPPAWFKPGQC